jgi:hypothetical protein
MKARREAQSRSSNEDLAGNNGISTCRKTMVLPSSRQQRFSNAAGV